MEKTEKRRKISAEDDIATKDDADKALAAMAQRQHEQSDILREARKQMVAVATVARSRIEALEKENEVDVHRLKGFYDANPPKTGKQIKLDHGKIGYKVDPLKVVTPKKKDEKKVLIHRIRALTDVVAAKAKSKKGTKDDEALLCAVAACIETEITTSIRVNALKKLSEEILRDLGIEVVPPCEFFFTDIKGGRLKDIEKLIRELGGTLKDAAA